MSGEARDSVRQSARPVIELDFGILVYPPETGTAGHPQNPPRPAGPAPRSGACRIGAGLAHQRARQRRRVVRLAGHALADHVEHTGRVAHGPGDRPVDRAARQASPISGPQLTRPRVGSSPTSPHSLAGMRMEPAPSVACATGTRPAATAAADPGRAACE